MMIQLSTHLFAGLEDVAPERVAGAVARYVAEYLEVVAVVRHVEYPVYRVVHHHQLALVYPVLLLLEQLRKLKE